MIVACLPLVALIVAVATAHAQTLSPPTVLGRLVGEGATQHSSGLHVFGNDLGRAFEHRGALHILFGDTSRHGRLSLRARAAERRRVPRCFPSHAAESWPARMLASLLAIAL